jgi:hypothetical protein
MQHTPGLEPVAAIRIPRLDKDTLKAELCLLQDDVILATVPETAAAKLTNPGSDPAADAAMRPKRVDAMLSAMTKKKSPAYLAINFYVRMAEANAGTSILHRIMVRLRHDEVNNYAKEHIHLHGINDIRSSTMLLIGTAGTATGFHVDRTEAFNILFALDLDVRTLPAVLPRCPLASCALPLRSPPCLTPPLPPPHPQGCTFNMDVPGAWWLFIDPNMLHIAIPLIRTTLGLASGASISKKTLTRAQADTFVAALRKKVHTERPPAFVVDQHAGQRVYVPPGWMHMVANTQPCLKLAFDVYKAANFPAYIQAWKRVATNRALGANAEDYMAANVVLAQSLDKTYAAELKARKRQR